MVAVEVRVCCPPLDDKSDKDAEDDIVPVLVNDALAKVDDAAATVKMLPSKEVV